MRRTLECEVGLSTRLSSSRLPTPDSSNRSEQSSDAGSPRSGYCEGFANRSHMYPPIVPKDWLDHDHSMSGRRANRFNEQLEANPHRATKPCAQSLPPLKLVLEDSLLSDIPKTPLQPSPREPTFAQNTYKPPALYPSRRLSTMHSSFDSAATPSSASTSSSPDRGHIGPNFDPYSAASISTSEGLYHSSDAARKRDIALTTNTDRPLYNISRDMPPPSPYQYRQHEYQFSSRTPPSHTNDYHLNDYFGHSWPRRHESRSANRPRYPEASERWRTPSDTPQLPSVHAGFVQDTYDQRYPRSPYTGPVADRRMSNAPRYDYATSPGKARKRSNLPKEATEAMKEWFERNLHNPYPTEDQKALMAGRFGISLTQVSNWFINHRRRCPELRDQREMATRVRRDNRL